MRARQGRREIAVALIGDDHRGAGLGNQQIGPGDADVGDEEFLAQDGARLRHQVLHVAQPARG